MKKLFHQLFSLFILISIWSCQKEELNTTTVMIGNNGEGVFISTNFNTNFTPANNGLEGNAKYIQCFLDKGSVIIIGTKGGLYNSTDNGRLWKPLNKKLSGNASSVTTLIQYGAKVLAGTQGDGIYISEDNGKNWEKMNTGLEGNGLIVQSLAIFDNKVYAATYNGMYKLHDDGITWKEINNGLTDMDHREVVGIADKGGDLFIITAGAGVKRSKDNGLNWLDISKTLPEYNMTSIYANDSLFFVGGSKGLYSYNNQAWEDISKNLPSINKEVKSIAYKNGELIVGTSTGGIFHSSDNGIVWAEIKGSTQSGDVNGILVR